MYYFTLSSSDRFHKMDAGRLYFVHTNLSGTAVRQVCFKFPARIPMSVSSDFPIIRKNCLCQLPHHPEKIRGCCCINSLRHRIRFHQNHLTEESIFTKNLHIVLTHTSCTIIPSAPFSTSRSNHLVFFIFNRKMTPVET